MAQCIMNNLNGAMYYEEFKSQR